MSKPRLPRITEPDEDLVHYTADFLSGNVTLCGLTDFIDATQGEETTAPMTCDACRSVVAHIRAHKD